MELKQLLRQKETFPASQALRQQANLQDFAKEYRRSLQDPEGFWGDWARRFHWYTPWEKGLEWNFPEHRWFIGGQTNVCYNAV
ncbi:acetyl-coenzyme A synthetase N-terminal domain-containing protein, partial [Acinetobacter baumannii]